MTRAGDIGEFPLIDRIARIMPSTPDIITGIGDDCAVIRIGDRILLATCDLVIEDIHFRRAYLSGEDIGWRAAVGSLSDIAAMGGRPICLLIALACPRDTELDLIESIAQGIASAARHHEMAVVGGDTTRSPSGIAIDVVTLGEATEGRYLLRNGAQPGDLLACTGRLGGAAAGLHALEHGNHAPELSEAFRRPSAQVHIGQWLVQQPDVHAMIDISDGLGQDAGHLAESSGRGLDIDSQAVPRHPNLDAYCASHQLDAAVVALTSGEEYQLAFAIDASKAESINHAFNAKFGEPFTIAGKFTDKHRTILVDGAALETMGYNHFAKPGND